MTYAEAGPLCDEITSFLFSCGDTYTRLTGELETNILWALASGQYVLKRDDNGKVLYFVSYWRLHPKDVGAMMDRVTPEDVFSGSIMYVTECGNKMGKKGMVEMIKALRTQAKGMKGVFWHRVRAGKEDNLQMFPKQEGSHGQQ